MGIDYTQNFNGTHYILRITYLHSIHTLKIVGTEAIPEFRSITILALFMVFSLAIVILKQRKR